MDYKTSLRFLVFGLAIHCAESSVGATQRRIDFVDPFIGTEYTGNVFPGPTRPFGLVQPSPDSGHGSGRCAAGYKHLEETIYGFSQTHLSGMGCGDLGDVLLLPYTGDDPVGTNLFCGAKDRFRETAKVGYYSVALTNFGVTAEIAASHRVGFHRWTFPDGAFTVPECEYRFLFAGPAEFGATLIPPEPDWGYIIK